MHYWTKCEHTMPFWDHRHPAELPDVEPISAAVELQGSEIRINDNL